MVKRMKKNEEEGCLEIIREVKITSVSLETLENIVETKGLNEGTEGTYMGCGHQRLELLALNLEGKLPKIILRGRD